jgi:hypothetical protein
LGFCDEGDCTAAPSSTYNTVFKEWHKGARRCTHRSTDYQKPQPRDTTSLINPTQDMSIQIGFGTISAIRSLICPVSRVLV